MGPVLLVALLACARLALVSASGTYVTLYNVVNGSSDPAATSVSVAPSLQSGPSPSTLGCTNLPSGFKPASGLFEWASPLGLETCAWVIFYTYPSCARSPDNSESGVASAASDTLISNFAASKYQANATRAVSLGCGYTFDPCSAYSCPDPNSICSSTSIIVKFASTGSVTSLYTGRDCNACKSGYMKVNGACVRPCDSIVCPAPGSCTISTAGVASCWCPDDWEWNPLMKQCDNVATRNWLTPLNAVRATVPGCINLSWNSTLADKALSQATGVNTTQCPAYLKDATLPSFSSTVYTKYGTKARGASENDAFIRSSKNQTDAVKLWMTASSLANGARINSTVTQQAGCAKAYCSGGTFFICLFWPFTY